MEPRSFMAARMDRPSTDDKRPAALQPRGGGTRVDEQALPDGILVVVDVLAGNGANETTIVALDEGIEPRLGERGEDDHHLDRPIGPHVRRAHSAGIAAVAP